MAETNTLPAFVIDAPDTIEWPVVVTHPIDGGERASFGFIGTFKRLSEAELDALLGVMSPPSEAASREGAEPERLAQVLAENARLFPGLLVGWRGIRAADGSELDFSRQRLEAAVRGPNGPYLSAGLWQAVAEIRHGARLGN